MADANTVLALKRPVIWERFRKLRLEPPPPNLTPKEAWHAGLQTGFNQGLLLGVGLGLEVGITMMTPDEEFDFAEVV